ncbi:MAG TPA: hypothetical protein VGJ55_10185, partial [Pyrinomonadaceae bacterium]
MRQAPACRLQPSAAKVNAPHSLRIGLVLLVLVNFFVYGCSKSEQAKLEGQPPPPPRAQPTQTQQASTLLPPRLDEVQDVVKRVFKDAALIDTGRNSNFITGDFNGDSSQDIAVILKPAPGKLAQMNEEIPPWILKDPFSANQSGTPPLRIAEGEPLLAVIHGYGPNGWRDPQATQTFLLKNAVGSSPTAEGKNQFVTANRGKKLPRLRGDLIGEVLRGTSGYIYYADATYAWYDPKTFVPGPEKRLVHGGGATI